MSDILGFLMDYFGWHDVWHPNPDQWYVGHWTGPDSDLLCVKRCETREEAEEHLSPQGTTLESAIRQAMNKLL